MSGLLACSCRLPALIAVCRRTYKAIQKGSELLVYYGDAYARELNIDVQALRKAPAAAPPRTLASGSYIVSC